MRDTRGRSSENSVWWGGLGGKWGVEFGADRHAPKDMLGIGSREAGEDGVRMGNRTCVGRNPW